ncbi:pyruvate dehydrogenase (acetyl-transferring) E1 component subunit alpha [Dactylosporangium fulvum]|uniref:2-oxoisovalerate dehydrogenase subunit alpha n=2 Tax=Dactylosporangium fulvum TaxID=53359 RepID=A0ABY5WB48_9ACTN|nr:thiamine pyrophosphate-dependent enzyme [Dactylosporangium fulvum]UWP86580.1 thiamine pyrophosphate-dependent enzyme [Dactylosporangium fulvum]
MTEPDGATHDPWSVLSPDGRLTPHHRVPTGPGALDLRGALRDMVLARRIDTEAIALQRQGELGLWPSMLGQEGAQVGAGYAIRPQDVVFPTYREHAVAWTQGVDPVNLLGLFRGTTMGGWDPRERNFHLYTLVIGAQNLHAVGYAMGLVRDGAVGTGDADRDRAVLVFLGDGALSEGETNEAFVWAATQDLPVVFFCQNNQWAISAPYATQSRIPAADRARGFGFPGVRVDGNDVIASHAVTTAALDRARQGGGPTLIEAVTYRLNPHTTSDDDLRYRSRDENEYWAQRDPIDRLRAYLTSEAAGDARIDEAFLADLQAESDALGERLRTGCRRLPVPAPADPFVNTLTELTPELARQLEAHLAFVAAGEKEHA